MIASCPYSHLSLLTIDSPPKHIAESLSCSHDARCFLLINTQKDIIVVTGALCSLSPFSKMDIKYTLYFNDNKIFYLKVY